MTKISFFSAFFWRAFFEKKIPFLWDPVWPLTASAWKQGCHGNWGWSAGVRGEAAAAPYLDLFIFLAKKGKKKKKGRKEGRGKKWRVFPLATRG